jgi:acetyl-CoA carboxylase / biotin carboxylase 1
VLLQARYLLRQCSLPFEERRTLMAERLESGDLQSMMQTSFGFDLLCSLMFDNSRAPHLAQLGLELFVRRSYFGVGQIESVDVYRVGTRGDSWQALQ